MDKKTQGKNNRARGKAFERKVRFDLESKGYIVCKWSNNVSEPFQSDIGEYNLKLISAKHTFNPFTKAMSAGNGFPDFIAYKCKSHNEYTIIGVESKMNGQLDRIEKEKCRWLLQNNIFSKILIAQRGIKRGEIIYTEFK